jgi:hypothetical protein
MEAVAPATHETTSEPLPPFVLDDPEAAIDTLREQERQAIINGHNRVYETFGQGNESQGESDSATDEQSGNYRINPNIVLDNPGLNDELENAAAKATDDLHETYLKGHLNREDNEALYDRIRELLQRTSVRNMDEGQWKLDEVETDADGNAKTDAKGVPIRKPGTSGRALAQTTVGKIRDDFGMTPANADPTEPTDPNTDPGDFTDPNSDPDNPQVNPGDAADIGNILNTADADTIVIPAVPGSGDPADPNKAPDLQNPEYVAAHDKLMASRAKLAELSIKRRQLIRKGGKKAEQLKQEFEDAQAEYQLDVQKYHTIQVKQNREAGLDDTEIRKKLIDELLEEHKLFSQAEYEVLNNDRSVRGKVARWLAKNHRLFFASAATGFAVGFGTKLLTKSAGIALGISAAPVALAAGAAIKTTKAVLTATVMNRARAFKEHQERADKDRERFHAKLRGEGEDITGDPTDSAHSSDEMVLRYGASKLQKVIGERVETDRKGNRNRVVAAVAISGAAAAVGVGVAEAAQHLGWFGGGGGNHPSGARPGGAGKPDGGSASTAPRPEGTGSTPSGGNTTPNQAGGTGSTPGGHNGTPGTGANGNTAPNGGNTSGNGGTTTGSGGHNGTPGNSNSGGAGSNPNTAPGTAGNETVDGYNTTAEIARGEGYQRAFADLAAQKGVHLSNEQSWALYQHLATQFHGNFFTDNPSYNMGHGNYGIGSAKTSHWDPRVVHAMNQWMLQNSNESEHAQFN